MQGQTAEGRDTQRIEDPGLARGRASRGGRVGPGSATAWHGEPQSRACAGDLRRGRARHARGARRWRGTAASPRRPARGAADGRAATAGRGCARPPSARRPGPAPAPRRRTRRGARAPRRSSGAGAGRWRRSRPARGAGPWSHAPSSSSVSVTGSSPASATATRAVADRSSHRRGDPAGLRADRPDACDVRERARRAQQPDAVARGGQVGAPRGRRGARGDPSGAPARAPRALVTVTSSRAPGAAATKYWKRFERPRTLDQAPRAELARRATPRSAEFGSTETVQRPSSSWTSSPVAPGATPNSVGSRRCSHLAHDRPPPARRPREAQRGGDGRLAHAALAGHEDVAGDRRAARSSVRCSGYVVRVRVEEIEETIVRSYERCRRMQRRHDPTFYWATRRLPAQHRPPSMLCTASCGARTRSSTGRAGPPTPPRAARAGRLAGGARGRPGRGPLRSSRARGARRCRRSPELPLHLLPVYMDSMRVDCDARVRIGSHEELDRYMDGSPATVGRIMAPLLGAPAAVHEDVAALGVAFQLTNFIRDVREDFELDRVYLPGLDEDAMLAARSTSASASAWPARSRRRALCSPRPIAWRRTCRRRRSRRPPGARDLRAHPRPHRGARVRCPRAPHQPAAMAGRRHLRGPLLAMTTPATKRGAERTSLEGTEVDVLICGASFAGLAVARELALGGPAPTCCVVHRYEIGERATSACAAPTPWLARWALTAAVRQELPDMTFTTPHGRVRYRLPWSWSAFDYAALCRALWAQAGGAATRGRGPRAGAGARDGRRGPHRPRHAARPAGRRRARLAARARRAHSSRPTRRSAAASRSTRTPRRAAHDALDVWVERGVVRRGYGWRVPAGDEARIGVGSYDPAATSRSRRSPRRPPRRRRRSLPGQLVPAPPALGHRGRRVLRRRQRGPLLPALGRGHPHRVLLRHRLRARAAGRPGRSSVPRESALARYHAFSAGHGRAFARRGACSASSRPPAVRGCSTAAPPAARRQPVAEPRLQLVPRRGRIPATRRAVRADAQLPGGPSTRWPAARSRLRSQPLPPHLMPEPDRTPRTRRPRVALAHLVEHIPAVTYIADADAPGGPPAVRLARRSSACSGTRPRAFLADDDLWYRCVAPRRPRAPVRDAERRSPAGADDFECEYRMVDADGRSTRSGSATPRRRAGRRSPGSRASWSTLTDLRRAESQPARRARPRRPLPRPRGDDDRRPRPDGRMTAVNRAGRELLGHAEGELQGVDWFDVRGRRSTARRGTGRRRRAARRGGRATVFESPVVVPDGSVREPSAGTARCCTTKTAR